jgi:hypothetical protein
MAATADATRRWASAAPWASAGGGGRAGSASRSYHAVLGLTQGVASVGGVAATLIAVATRVPAYPEWVAQDGLGMVVLVGVGKSLAPLALACGFLTALGLLVALGLRRTGDGCAPRDPFVVRWAW